MLNTKFRLPNGSVLKNRLAKSAMSENMADGDHGPNALFDMAYHRWAKGGTGLIITGNVMIDQRALGEAYNVVVEDKRHFAALRTWAASVHGTGAHIWPQLNHPGRQAVGFMNKEVYAPSAVPLQSKQTKGFFKEPKALSEEQILDIIERYGNSALIMKEAGFTGVQIHGAHGYLVSQFLSPLVNQRNDQWGGSLEKRAKFAIEVYRNIRGKVGADYPVGIKINSADFQRGGFTEEESMEVVKLLSQEGMDLIEISGGTYERPAMMEGNKKASTVAREAYFLDYVEKVRKLVDTPLMLTGGFRSKSVMEQAVAEDKLDIIGLARPFAIYPDLAHRLLVDDLERIMIPEKIFKIKALNDQGFAELLWYELHIRRLGEGKAPNPNLNPYKIFAHNIGMTLKKVLMKPNR